MPAFYVTFEVTRQSPTSMLPVVRDFGISAGDDFTLRLKVYAADGDTSPVNVSGAVGTLTLWKQGGTEAELTVAGAVASPSTAGNVDFYFAPQYTSDLEGRYLWQARIELTSGSVVARGSVNIRETMQEVEAVDIAPTPDPTPEPDAATTLNAVLMAGRALNPRARAPMHVPPDITVSTTATAGLTNQYLYGSARQGVFRGFGGYTEIFNVTFGRFRSSIVSGAPSSHSWRVECIVDAAVCDVRLMTILSTQRFRFIVDGQYVDAAGIALTSTLTRHMVRLDFRTRKPRHLVIEGEGNSLIEGIAVGPTEAVYRAPGTVARLYLQGDSFGAASNATRFLDGLAHVGADWLGARDCWVGAIGGTGWLNPGTGQTTFRQRNSALIAAAPDIVVMAGGHNDRTYDAAAMTTEVQTWITETRAALPDAKFIIMGAWPGDFGPSADFIVTENAIAAGVTAANDTNTFFIPVSTDPEQPWLFGTGNEAAPNGSGNSDVYISTDLVHPNTAGHAMLGKRMAASISQVLGLGSIEQAPAIDLEGGLYPAAGAMARTVTEYAFRRRFAAPDGGVQFQIDQVPLATEYWRGGGGIAGAGAYMLAWSDAAATANAVVVAKGTGSITLGNGAGPLLEARDTGASLQVDAPVIVRGGAQDYTTHPGLMAPNLRALWLGIDTRPIVRLSEDATGDATNAGWRISVNATTAKMATEGAATNINAYFATKGTGSFTFGNDANGSILFLQRASGGTAINVPYIQPGISGQPADIAMSPANGLPLRLGVGGRVNIAGGFVRGGKLVRNAASGYANVTIASTVSRVLIDGAGTIAAADFTMPASADITDGHEISFTASQTVTALTLTAGAGQTIVGGPTTMGTTSPFTLAFDSTTGKWTRC